MGPFVSKHAEHVIGTLSGFDRLVFRGTLRMLAHRGGLMTYLSHVGVLLKNFGQHAEQLTEQLKDASTALARRIARPVRYLASAAVDKEAIARDIAAADQIKQGLICILTAVEPCLSYEIVHDRANKRIEIEPRQRKCLFLYHYQVHPRFGFMHGRIQTWFPFAIQVCLNGREWLAHSMDRAGLSYQRRDNCFTWLQQPERAQRLMDRQLQSDWPDLLNGIARSLNSAHRAMFAGFPMDYYWSTYQSEWATDLMFRDPAMLARLYPKLVHHGLTTFLSTDVMRFLGRKVPPRGHLPPRLAAEVVSDLKQRPEGVRIKHRVGDNSVKMYDKQGSVLRVETTINDPGLRRGRRGPVQDLSCPREPAGRHTKLAAHAQGGGGSAPACRGLAGLQRTLPDGARLGRGHHVAGRTDGAAMPAGQLQGAAGAGDQSARGGGRRPAHGDQLWRLRSQWPAQPRSARSAVRQGGADQGRAKAASGRGLSRKLRLLRAHRLIRKVPHTHRYHLTNAGRTVVTALMAARNANTQELANMAA